MKKPTKLRRDSVFPFRDKLRTLFQEFARKQANSCLGNTFRAHASINGAVKAADSGMIKSKAGTWLPG